MNMGLRSGVTPEGFCAGPSLRISDVGECPQLSVPMTLIGMEQRFCSRVPVRTSDVGCCAQLGVATRLIGIRRGLCAGAFFGTSDVGDHPPPPVPMSPIEREYTIK